MIKHGFLIFLLAIPYFTLQFRSFFNTESKNCRYSIKWNTHYKNRANIRTLLGDRTTPGRHTRIHFIIDKKEKERLVNKTSFRGCSKKKRGEHMGRKYRMGEGNTWISWCAIYRAQVRPLNALHRSRTWAHGPRRRRAPPSRTRTPSTPSLINGMRYYGGW